MIDEAFLPSIHEDFRRLHSTNEMIDEAFLPSIQEHPHNEGLEFTSLIIQPLY